MSSEITISPAFWPSRRAIGAAIAGRDPRWWQIAALSSLVAVGVGVLRFDMPLWHPPAAMAAALGAQWVGARAVGRRFDPLSAMITGLSLTLLLRAAGPETTAMAAAIAIWSKFLVRWRGRHFFNPANIGIVVVTALSAEAWISPGQWGAAGLLAVTIAGVGAMVAGRAARLDSTLGFLGVWSALVVGRALWLGDPMAIAAHQLQSGALLVFAFFMISDPATTPRARSARFLHAAVVAGVGFALQTFWLTNSGPIWALALLAPLTPLLDWLWRDASAAGRPLPSDRKGPSSCSRVFPSRVRSASPRS